jgi:ribosome-binding factor A
VTEQGGNPRRARVAQTIRMHLSEMIHRELKDPRIGGVPLISVNQVELNRDMSIARVYVGFPGASEKAATETMAALGAGAKRLRGPLARRMNLARAPQLRFELDTSDEFNFRLTEIVREDERRRADVEPESDAEPGDGAGPRAATEADPEDGADPRTGPDEQ